MSKLQPKFKTPDDLAEWLGMSTFESTESKEEVLMQIQDEGEQRLEAACERLVTSFCLTMQRQATVSFQVQ